MSLRMYYRGPATGDRESILDILTTHHPLIAVDTETISLKDRTCIGIGIQTAENEGFYFQVLPETSDILPVVMTILASPHVTKIYHNAMFDLGVLTEISLAEGWPLPDYTNIEDTSIMAQVRGDSTTLAELGQEYLNYSNPLSIADLLSEARVTLDKKNVTMLDVPFERVAEKCLNDVYTTYKLFHHYSTWPTANVHSCYTTDRNLIPVLKTMEARGLRLKPEVIEGHRSRLGRECKQLSDICEGLGFNPGSPQQVGYILASRGNILPISKSGKQLSTDEESLEKLDDPLAALVLTYRKLNKLLSTYVEPWTNEQRATTHFRIDLSTGRLASYDRNLQNIPPDMRNVFTPDNGVFSWMDYSQIEMRLLSYLSQDRVMQSVYAEGGDVHAQTQLALWPGSDTKDESKRLVAKTFNFALAFNAQPGTLAAQCKIPIALATNYRKVVLSLYPGIAMYMQRQMAIQNYYVESDFGRRMRLPDPSIFPKSHIDKCKINYAIQGTAADIIKRAMLKVYGDLRLQVHDELIVDGDYDFDPELSDIHPAHIPFKQYKGEVWK